MSEPGTLANVSITIEGVGNPVAFSALIINQQLADVNDFSFNWRQEAGTASLSGYIAFNRTHLAAKVTIDINDEFTFKGIIYAINCVEQDSNGITYEIAGKGLFVKLAEIPESNSFYQKDLRHIFNAVNITSGTTLQLNPRYTSDLFYTVQYNQTAFDFYKMTAARYGEWLYYNGQELILGTPSGTALDISDTEIDNLTFRSRVDHSPVNAIGYDAYRGEIIRSTEQASRPGGTGFIAANMEAGNGIQSATDYAQYAYVGAPTEGLLSAQSLLQQQGRAAASVVVTGTTFNSALKLAGKINLTDNSGNSFGEYIITELHHYAAAPDNYQNYFSAIPAEAEAPPYTNPMLHPHCPAQMAVVTSNADEDGQDRVKVRFPWQASSETTPWLKVVVPQAGQGYGFRFLPEVDDVVYVDFLNNDPELPFVMGSVYTDNRQSQAKHEGNNVKIIGTRTGRRLELDDDQGIVALRDNLRGQYPKNIALFTRKDSTTQLGFQSQASDGNRTAVVLNNDEELHLYIMDNSMPKAEIILKKDGTVEINSEGNIKIKAKEDLELEGMNVKIKATQKVSIEGISAVKITSPETEVEGTGTMKVKGAQVEVKGDGKASVEGGGMLELKASGIASLQGSLVKIN
jgi:type VI secretion system secreted protein VgrG